MAVTGEGGGRCLPRGSSQGVCPRGCLPRGVSVQGGLTMSARGRGCLTRGVSGQGGVCQTPPLDRMTDTCKTLSCCNCGADGNKFSGTSESHCWCINFYLLLWICLTSVNRVKCSVCSTLCWKIGNISGSTELFGL